MAPPHLCMVHNSVNDKVFRLSSIAAHAGFTRDSSLLAVEKWSKSKGCNGSRGGIWRGRERSLMTLCDLLRVDALLVSLLGGLLGTDGTGGAKRDAGRGRKARLSLRLTSDGCC